MSFIRSFNYILITITIILNVYIFTYPSLDTKQCSWNSKSTYLQNSNPLVNYFKDLYSLYFGNLVPEDITSFEKELRLMAFGDPQIKGNWPSTPYLKKLDTYGNDYYLGHIYKVMKNRLNPTHVVALGDLFSSQWIGDSEFFNRTKRYVTRLYNQPEEHIVPILDYISKNEQVDWIEYSNDLKSKNLEDFNWEYQEVFDWTTADYSKKFAKTPLFLNVSGNHDIGYSGDATWQHMARYNKLFGKDNFWIEYNKGTPQAFRIVVLNSLLLEGPALQPEFLEYTWEFLYKLFEQRFKGSTILLTHVPFYKKEGLCVDGPYHEYYNEETMKSEHYKNNLLRSQNHLSQDVTQRVLNLIFDESEKYPGIILTGHDHEGCESYYSLNNTDYSWYSTSSKPRNQPFVKEITVRAMMGEYGGNTGLLTGKFSQARNQWDFHFSLCPFIIQHVWWFTKIISIISLFTTSFIVIFNL
ncbi:hypothetical protein WICMUC_001580 [Wickerhamomyces mucosus]|uniref:Calcineurin-like phosphoesterase domain-containing protein n=1 Tax=Wickerhamomyces mucosus TaxID=1378264 RepID=A0A9P8PTZ0_9ASCO|nr:hypothetical protein WICMUC_001580 [Wickerhamomyces mucosus]